MIANTKGYMKSHRCAHLIVALLLCFLFACKSLPPLAALQKKGSEEFRKKNYSGAIEYYKQALLLRPNSASINFNLGLCYRKFKLYDKAAPYFIAAVDFEQKDSKKIKYEKLLEEAYTNIFTTQVESVDNIGAYEEFLDSFPEMIVKYSLEGRMEQMKYFQKKAEDRLQELIFNEVKLTNVPRAYELYIQYYPDSKYIEEANILLDTVRFEVAKEKSSVEAFDIFIKKYPESSFLQQAIDSKDDLIFEEYKFKETLEDWWEFAVNYKDNRHYLEAIDKINKMIKDKKDVDLYEQFVEDFSETKAAEDISKSLDKIRYNEIKKLGTIEAYEDFVNDFPESKFIKAAEHKLVQLHYEKAKTLNTIDAYDEFVTLYKDSKYAVVAEERKLALVYEIVKRENTKKAYQDFLKDNPLTKFQDDAEKRIMDIEYQETLNRGDIISYKLFLSKYKDSVYYSEIKARLDELKFTQVDDLDTIPQLESYIIENVGTEFAYVAKRKLDRLRFQKIKNTSNIVDVLSFIKSYPNNRYIGDAHDLLDDLRYKASVKYNQLPNLLDFLEKYPDSKHIEDIKERIDTIKINEIKSYKTVEELELYINENPNSQYLPYAYKLKEKYIFDKAKKKGTINAYEIFIKMHPDNRYVPDAKKKIKELQNEISREKKLNNIRRKRSVRAIMEFSDKSKLEVYDLNLSYEFNRQPSYALIPGIDDKAIGFEIEADKVKSTFINPISDIASIKFFYKKKSSLFKMFGKRELVLSRIRIAYTSDIARDLNGEWNKRYIAAMESDSEDVFYTEVYLNAQLEKKEKGIVVQLFEYSPAAPYLEKITFIREE
jgi:outer membrane protein assembly factor BamD (BamD/ComL family)